MPTKTKLSIVIPAKNEEKRISKTLSNYSAYFDSRSKELEVEIIVVVNNSNDYTCKIVDEYSQKYPFIKRIETHYASGKGGAVALGFEQAEGDYISFVDADGAVPASEIYNLYEFLDETPWLDVVIGVRDKSSSKMSLKRRLLSNLFNLYVWLLFDLPYTDTQCGAKVFRKKPAKAIAGKLSNTGWAFDVNLLLIAKYLNFRVLEHPVVWSEKEGSKFSLYQAFIKVPVELISLKVLELSHQLNRAISDILGMDFTAAEKEKKNILIFAWRDIKHPETGGSEVYVHEIAKRLTKNNNVTLFTSKPGNLNSIDKIDGVRIIRKGSFFTVYVWAFLYYIFKLRKKTDFIIDVENGIPFFSPLFSTKPKILLVHHVHKNQWFKQFPVPIAVVGYVIESFLMPIFYRKIPVVTVSPSSLMELKKLGFKDRQVYIAYNSIPSRIGPNYPESPDPLLVYIGRVKAYKRVEIALQTLKTLSKEFPSIKMIIGGVGDHIDKLKIFAKKLGLENHVEFLGFISEKKKWEVMQKGWVFLMPSMKEGWGITIIEAASCGTPSVGFDVLGVRDSIRNGFTGFLADDEDDYLLKVKFLLNTPKARRNMAKNCEIWADMFSWSISASVFGALIDKGLSRNGLLSDKVYPWELDLRTEAVTTLIAIK